MTVEIFQCLKSRILSPSWGCLQLEAVSLLHSKGGVHSCWSRERCLERSQINRQISRAVFCWVLELVLCVCVFSKIEETCDIVHFRQGKNDV